MEFKFKNFGKVGSGTVRLNDLSIICGPNNTGKTYINYAIYSILKNFPSIFDFGLDTDVIKDALSKIHKKHTVEIDLNGVSTQLSNVKSKFVKIMGSDIADFFQLPLSNFKNTEIFIRLRTLKLEKVSKEFQLSKNLYGEYVWQKSGCSLVLSLKENGINSISDYPLSKSFINICLEEIVYQIFEIHFSEILPRPISITSERTGISLFYKSFDTGNQAMIRSIRTSVLQGKSSDYIKDIGYGFAEAIEDNIFDSRYFEEIKKETSFIVKEKRKEIISLFNKITDNGSYISKNNSLYYLPDKSKKEPTIPLQSSSSSVKSFFLFDLFIRNVAREGDLLVIDEPELNLYIGKQIEMAHLIARLIKAGVKVLITTHSDFFVMEINNLIGLENSDENERTDLMKEFKIDECDLLKQSQVSAYKTSENSRVSSLDVYPSGIKPDDWNSIIAKVNIKSERIFDMLRNKK